MHWGDDSRWCNDHFRLRERIEGAYESAPDFLKLSEVVQGTF